MKPSIISEECGQKQRRAGYQSIIIISPSICVSSSNERHGAGTWGDGRSLRKGSSQKLSHEIFQTSVRLPRNGEPLHWVKMHVIEKHADQRISQLRLVDPKNTFSARKKTVSTHFSRLQSQCLQPKACTRLSDSTARRIENFPLGLQETRCLSKVATQGDPVKVLEISVTQLMCESMLCSFGVHILPKLISIFGQCCQFTHMTPNSQEMPGRRRDSWLSDNFGV